MIEMFLPYLLDDVVSVNSYTLAPTGMTNYLATVLNILGDPFVAVMVEHSGGDYSSFVIINPVFIAGTLLFMICLWSCFRIIGSVLFRR